MLSTSQMNMINNNTPFSLKWHQTRDKAGGMNVPKAITELFDNDLDAQETPGYSYLKSFETKDGMAYLLHFSSGHGLHDLARLFGLGQEIFRKNPTKIGNFIYGHCATIAFFNPTNYYAESKIQGETPNVLSFRVNEFDTAVSQIGSTGTDNYRTVEINKYLKIEKNRESLVSKLELISKNVKDLSIKQELQKIIQQGKESYMLNLMEFENGHPFQQNLVDKELEDFFPSLSLHYGKFLSNGYSIVFEKNTTSKNAVLQADLSTSLTPLIKKDIYPSIQFEVSLRQAGTQVYADVLMTCNSKDKKFYISNNAKEKKPPQPCIVEVEDEAWQNSEEVGNFVFSVNCPSEIEFKKHSNSLGTDLKTVDKTRGIYLQFRGRNLGKPFWDPSFGSERNSGYLGAVLEVDSKKILEDFVGYQSNKHNCNLSESHPIVQGFLKLVMKGIISKFTNYKVKSSKEGVKQWDIERVMNAIVNKKEKSPPKPKPKKPDTNPQVDTIPQADTSPQLDNNLNQEETTETSSDDQGTNGDEFQDEFKENNDDFQEQNTVITPPLPPSQPPQPPSKSEFIPFSFDVNVEKNKFNDFILEFKRICSEFGVDY